jgi:hypothetical protein
MVVPAQANITDWLAQNKVAAFFAGAAVVGWGAFGVVWCTRPAYSSATTAPTPVSTTSVASKISLDEQQKLQAVIEKRPKFGELRRTRSFENLQQNKVESEVAKKIEIPNAYFDAEYIKMVKDIANLKEENKALEQSNEHLQKTYEDLLKARVPMSSTKQETDLGASNASTDSFRTAEDRPLNNSWLPSFLTGSKQESPKPGVKNSKQEIKECENCKKNKYFPDGFPKISSGIFKMVLFINQQSGDYVKAQGIAGTAQLKEGDMQFFDALGFPNVTYGQAAQDELCFIVRRPAEQKSVESPKKS